MQQLPLGIRLRASSVFESYWAGPNATAVEWLKKARAPGSSPVSYVYGQVGTGKTHLLQALCAYASDCKQPATYLPLREVQAYGPEILEGCEGLAVVCLDDVSSAMGAARWDSALFNLYRELDESGGKLVVADEQAPAALNFGLPDLASRILGGMAMRLQPLEEAEQYAALRLRAAQRGLDLTDEVIAYLLRRLRRDMRTLCDFIDELDIASLAAQRRLTLPFVRDVLDARSQQA